MLKNDEFQKLMDEAGREALVTFVDACLQVRERKDEQPALELGPEPRSSP